MRNEEIVIRMDEEWALDGQRVLVRGFRRQGEGAFVLLAQCGPGAQRCIEVLLRDARAIEQAEYCMHTRRECVVACRPKVALHFLAGPWDGEVWTLVDDDALEARCAGKALSIRRKGRGAQHEYVFEKGCYPHTMYVRDAGYVG
jgi:hypothetical protein